jgi:N-acetylneuraminic acid mutarotase
MGIVNVWKHAVHGFGRAWILALALSTAGAHANAAGPDKKTLNGHLRPEWAGKTPVSTLHGGRTLRLSLALPWRNHDTLTAFLGAVTDPKNPNYRHFLSNEDFIARYAPTAEDYAQVEAFAKRNGLTVVGRHGNRAVLDVSGSVDTVAKTFGVRINNYRREDQSEYFAPENEPAVEAGIPIGHIGGLDNFHLPKTKKIISRPPKKPRLAEHSASGANNGALEQGTGVDGGYQGGDLAQIYGQGVPAALNGNGQRIGLLEMDGYYPADITEYKETSVPPFSAPAPINVLVDGFAGSPVDVNGNGEVSLDIEVATAVAPGAQIVVYEGNYWELPYDEAADDVLEEMATPPLCMQLSSSWYDFGDDTTAQILEQMAAQGQAFMLASGDYCAYGADDTYQMPEAPAGVSPFITVVGGTEVFCTTTASGALQYQSECVWDGEQDDGDGEEGFGSGGGICINQLPLPAYQAAVPMTQNGGSTQWRNVPDVAALAENLSIYCNDGESGLIGGTSAAAPIWAAFLALANQQATAGGGGPIGFLNPLLYSIGQGSQYASCFNDITVGNNENPVSGGTYFNAVQGYDLATGWGSPKGEPLIQELASMALQIPATPQATATPFPQPAACGSGTKLSVQWTIFPFPTAPFSGFTAVSNVAYEFGGLTPTSSGTMTYSPYLAWTNLSTLSEQASYICMPIGVAEEAMGLVPVNGILYIIGGLGAGGVSASVYAYNTSTETITTKASLPVAIFGAGYGAVGSNIYVFGGLNASGATLNSVYCYNTVSNSWSKLSANMPAACALQGSASYNGVLYSAGGVTNFTTGAATSALYAFNPSSGSWTTLASMPYSVSGPAAAVADGVLYVAGGSGNGAAVANVVGYSIANNTWSNQPPLFQGGGQGNTMVAVGNTLYLAGNSSMMGVPVCEALATTPTPVWTRTPGPSCTSTPAYSATATATLTRTRTPSPSVTWSPSSTASPSASGTSTSTGTATGTCTRTPTWTVTFSRTPTFSASPTVTPTFTVSESFSATPTDSVSPTPSLSSTPTGSFTLTQTFTASPTVTTTASDTPYQSPTTTQSYGIASTSVGVPAWGPVPVTSGQPLTLFGIGQWTGSYKLFTFSGQWIASGNLSNGTMVSTSGLTQGVYFLWTQAWDQYGGSKTWVQKVPVLK